MNPIQFISRAKRDRAWMLPLAFVATQAFCTSASAVTDEERAGAREAAKEGSLAFNEGRLAASIDLFTRAESLVHSPVHLLFIARAQGKLGNLVKARETYLKLAREQLADDAPDVFRRAVESAKSESAELDARIPRVSVSVDGPGAGEARVKLDGKEIPNALIGVPQPVDPGRHTLQAFAPGAASEPSEVSVAESERTSVVLSLKPVPNAAVAEGPVQAPTAPSTPAGESDAPSTHSAAVGPDDLAATSGLRIGSYVGLGVGVLGLGAGVYFGLDANSKADERDQVYDSCRATGCKPLQARIEDLDDGATRSATIATVGWVAGGVGLAAGATLFVLSFNDSTEGAAIVPWLGPQSVGVSGRF